MGIFIFLLIIGLAAKYIAAQEMAVKTACKGHKWVYKNLGTDQEYMVCTQCALIPGINLKN